MVGKFSIVLTTTGSESKARELAAAALGAHLAACVQIHQIESRYVWKGGVKQEPETALQFKIATADFEALCALIRSLHDYAVPEILRIDVADGDDAYLEWLGESVKR